MNKLTENGVMMMMNKNEFKENSISRKLGNHIKVFFKEFSEQSAIHGFLYLGKSSLHYIERLLWLALIGVTLYFCTIISLESWDRYLTKSTVVAIEKDYYYWNTSLPSLTACPAERIDKTLFDNYCSKNSITGKTKDEFFKFVESLANSTYINFEHIEEYPSVDTLNIEPKSYMELIYKLTDDLTTTDEEPRVHTIMSSKFIRTIQVLTEYGICYTTNNIIAANLTTNWLLKREPNKPNPHQTPEVMFDVRYGNLFDGDLTYSVLGFKTPITFFIHSSYETINIARRHHFTERTIEFEASSIEVITSKQFREDTTVEQRGCRFNTESNLTHFEIYTKQICLQECRLNLAMEYCGCIPHFYPNNIANPKKVCHYKVLKKCFPPKTVLLLEFHKPDSRETVPCNCLMNCVESNIVIEKIKHLSGFDSLIGSVGGLLTVRNYPLIRYKRQVLFTFTDLLVSIGATAGFFLGFSVLGLVEVFYFYTLRLFWYILGSR